ncbi:hypothetical protein ACPJHQ_17235 [Rossellomorea sp. H39__3]|uniref:hypothetical protein n=1 Tax=Rossellomorea marisflavi TaxID=189381 RepID=UPI001BC9594C|nr:hypothetical protein [Rossellomorea marisflavi]
MRQHLSIPECRPALVVPVILSGLVDPVIPAVPVVHPILVFLVVLQALVDPLPLVDPVSLQALVDPVVPEVLVVPEVQEEEGKSHIPVAEVLCSNHTGFVCY